MGWIEIIGRIMLWLPFVGGVAVTLFARPPYGIRRRP